DESKWRSPIHMTREMSRITLQITRVRVERLQAISEADAEAEGLESYSEASYGNADYQDCWRNYMPAKQEREWPWFVGDPVKSYRSLWDSQNAKRGHGWETNPWVWVIEFKMVDNKDAKQ
ncbi:MAG: hypothetical protein H7839_24425, partial [Magnetococcus sp. YQC-5]